MDIHRHRILILDFGSQYSQLIARRVRELGVYCELLACDSARKKSFNFNPHGIILSGGPETLTSEQSPRIPECVFTLNRPVLGICYGMQAMASNWVGRFTTPAKENMVTPKCGLKIQAIYSLKWVNHLDVWMSHGDYVTHLPPGFTVIATTNNSPYAAIADFQKKFYGLQFHPEVTHTAQGQRILSHFVLDICGCTPTWNASNIIDRQYPTCPANSWR